MKSKLMIRFRAERRISRILSITTIFPYSLWLMVISNNPYYSIKEIIAVIKAADRNISLVDYVLRTNTQWVGVFGPPYKEIILEPAVYQDKKWKAIYFNDSYKVISDIS